MARGRRSGPPAPPDPAGVVTSGSAVEDRRERILWATSRVIGERGFADTRITDVATAAQVSSALVIYYYGTRDRLLAEALRYSEDLFYAAMSTRLSALDGAASRLAEAVRLSCVPHAIPDMPGAWVLWLDLWAQAPRHPEISRDREQLDERWRTTIMGLVRAGQDEGVFGPADPEAFALTLCALLDGLAVQIALGDTVVTPERAYQIAMDLCSLVLGPADPRPADHPGAAGAAPRPEGAI